MSAYRATLAYRQATTDRNCPLSPTARLLWAALASHADWDGACFPKVATLRLMLGSVSRWTVQRAAAELVEYGVLEVLAAHGRGRSNTYRLDLAPETKDQVRNGAPVHRLPACGQLENGARVHENGAPVLPHIGEVEGEVEESAREQIDLSTLKPGDVIRCPRRPTRAGCQDDCPLCHGMHHVHVERLLERLAVTS